MHLRAANKGVGLVRKLLKAFASVLLIPSEVFPIVGLTSVICPDGIGMQEEGRWGEVSA